MRSKELRVINLGVINPDPHVTSTQYLKMPFIMSNKKTRTKMIMSSQEKLIHSFITSMVNYCNSLSSFPPKMTIRKLQHIQKCQSSNKKQKK